MIHILVVRALVHMHFFFAICAVCVCVEQAVDFVELEEYEDVLSRVVVTTCSETKRRANQLDRDLLVFCGHGNKGPPAPAPAGGGTRSPQPG